MTTRYYRSTDPGAPVLTGQPGSLLNLLDTCLVGTAGIAYSGIPSAGWSKPFHDPVNHKAAFRNSLAAGGSGVYARVDDSGTATAAGAREACVRLFSAMSDIDTGSDPTPTVAQAANGTIYRKSQTIDIAARKWFLVADGRTLTMYIQSNDTINGGRVIHFGDYEQFSGTNPFPCVINISDTGGNTSATGNVNRGIFMPSNNLSETGVWVMRDHTLAVGAKGARTAIYSLSNNNNYIIGSSQFPAITVNNPLWLHRAPICTDAYDVGRIPLGLYRGLLFPENSMVSLYPASGTFDDMPGRPAGSKLLLINSWGSSSSNPGYYGFCMVETALDW